MTNSRRRRVRRRRAGAPRGGHRNRNIVAEVTNEPSDTYTWNTDLSPHIRDENLKKIFLSITNFKTHYEAQSCFENRYFAVLCCLINQNVQLNENAKALALTVAWARREYSKASFLLQLPGEVFHIKEVLKAVTLLDSARQKRAMQKILQRLNTQGCKKRSKLNKIKASIASLEMEMPSNGSLSSALIRQIKLWIKAIPVERLEFFALYFPTESWKKLSDLCHLNPKKDIPQCPWFLPFCFGAELPGHLQEISAMSVSKVSEIVLSGTPDYAIVRKYKEGLSNAAKQKIASYSNLDSVFWYYEELKCEEVNNVINRRLQNGEQITLSYGKLMEKIISFKFASGGEVMYLGHLIELANAQLKQIKLDLESPVSVIGDMSASMDVAIVTSNIIASLLTAITAADLVFFNSKNNIPPFIPKNVTEVLELCTVIKACNSTNPAASLYPYYKEKKIFKTFFIVTDEEENGTFEGHNFPSLFKKYYHEVYESRLVFITFAESARPSRAANMVSNLQRLAPEIEVIKFSFDSRHPDLTKLDNVLGVLTTYGDGFKKKLDRFEKYFEDGNIAKAFEEISTSLAP